MQIRHAGTQDIPGIDRLLSQVLTVHHNGRPDLFRANARKYNDDELKEILEDTTRPIFVADDGAGNILGYAFCVFQQHTELVAADAVTVAAVGIGFFDAVGDLGQADVSL